MNQGKEKLHTFLKETLITFFALFLKLNPKRKNKTTLRLIKDQVLILDQATDDLEKTFNAIRKLQEIIGESNSFKIELSNLDEDYTHADKTHHRIEKMISFDFFAKSPIRAGFFWWITYEHSNTCDCLSHFKNEKNTFGFAGDEREEGVFFFIEEEDRRSLEEFVFG